MSQGDWGERERSTRGHPSVRPLCADFIVGSTSLWKGEGLWDAKYVMNLLSSAYFRHQKRELTNIVSGKIREKKKFFYIYIYLGAALPVK